MIDVHCTDCGRVLIGSRQILALTSGAAGMEVAYVCGCGRPGAEVIARTSRRRRPRLASSGNETSLAGVGR